MAFCSNCGRPLGDYDKFCSGCGKARSDVKEAHQRSTDDLDVTVDAKVVLRGTKDEKTEVVVFVPELNQSIRVMVPNFAEEGQRIRIRGVGLTGASGQKGDLYVNLSKVDCYDIELTTSVTLSGNADSSTKVFVYLPHTKNTVQVSVPNNTTTDQTLRLKGLGLENPTGEKGDVYLHFDHIEYATDHFTTLPMQAENQSKSQRDGKSDDVKQCPVCLKLVPAHASFCLECGAPLSDVAKNKQAERKIVYEGAIHKCPHCGNIINQSDVVCSACGYHLSGKQAVSSAADFQQQLFALERNRQNRKFGFWDQREDIDATDKQVIALIKSYPIPNSIDDIVEFFHLALGNIEISKSKKSFFNSDFWDGESREREISNAWVGKLQQIYKKAELFFPSEPEFAHIKETYLSIMKELKWS